MRRLWLLLGSTIVFAPTAAIAADQLKFGKPPEWVVQQDIPAPSGNSPSAPIAILLSDQQVRFEPGKTTTYTEAAMKLQTPAGLAAGNISLPWNPANDTVTVNKLQIRRGNQVIDILASGQSFTTIRRETNLELAMLDGFLTANIQPEGLRQGDIIDLATTIEHVDPVFGKHVETNFMQWSFAPIQLAHFRLDWPDSLPLVVQAKGMPLPQAEHGGRRSIEVTKKDSEPFVPPKGAPLRYRIGPFGEASDLPTWAAVASLMEPIYRKAEAIPASGSLHDEVEKIRASTKDPKLRASKALQLVQDQVRYLALAMGEGGYVPADAATTWSRRFGDCKAKTVLLLGILHSLAIDAEPILVNVASGDAIADRLPMAGMFDHVLVRAHLAGRTYYLDGTRTGDLDIDAIEVPNFGWGLPISRGAKLVAMVPPPLDRPTIDTKVMIDATSGIRAKADVSIIRTLHGDGAIEFNQGLGALTEAQRVEFFERYWKSGYGFVAPGLTKTKFDAANRTLTLTMTGTGKLDWTTGAFHLPDSTLGFAPDFERPDGPLAGVPVSVSYPGFVHNLVVVRFPHGFFGARPTGSAPASFETLAGVEYRMSVNHASSPDADTLNVETSERSIVPEVPYKDALAASTRLRELSDIDVAAPLPGPSYRLTKADLAEWLTEKPTTADAYLSRGNALMEAGRPGDALADFNQAIAFGPTNGNELAARAIAYLLLGDIAKAEKDIAAADALHIDRALSLRVQGLLAEQKGDTASAIRLYSQSLKEQPDNVFSLLHRAKAYGHSRQFEEASGDLKTLEKSGAAEIYVDVLSAELAADKGEFQQAIDLFTKALAAQPTNGQLLNERAQQLHAIQQDDRALADSETALKITPDLVDARLLRANIFRDRGNVALAVAEADALFQSNAKSQYALVAAGRIYAAFGVTEKAMRSFDRAMEIKPAAYIYLNRAQVRPKLDFAAQLADVQEARKLEPENRDALVEEASIFLHQGKYDKALADYDEALKNNTESMPGVVALRAIALFKAGRVAESEQSFATLESKAAGNAAIWNNLCWTKATYAVLMESALDECNRAVKLQPSDGNYVDSLGFILLRLGRLDEALSAYNSALTKNNGPSPIMGRALVYARKGDLRHAEADHAAALKLEPTIDDRYASYGLKFADALEAKSIGH